MEKFLLFVSFIFTIGFGSAYPSEEREGSSNLCDICGIQATSSKIFNGVDALEGEFPWRVSFRVEMKAACSGTIINKNWVLTAAHCMDKLVEAEDSIYIRAGSVREENGGQAIVVNGLAVTKHKRYVNDDGIIWNDTALIKVPDPGFDFSNPNIKPVCLPYKLGGVGIIHKGLASGWGHTNSAGSTPEIMRKANIKIADSEYCNQFVFDKISYLKGFKIDAEQICTTSANATICEGDSGGSIDYKDDRGRYYAVGINSYGLSHCGSSDNVNVMVKIAMYLRWIEKHTGEKFCKK